MSEPHNEKPLDGRTVVITRAPEQAGELMDHLTARGAEVLLMPAVYFVEPEDSRDLDQAIAGLATFDWVLFTSQNAVRFFCQRAQKLGQEYAGPRYGAVGPATARFAEKEGLSIAHVASKSTGVAWAADLGPELRGKRVLLPRSDRARADLPAALRAAGATVVDVVAYRTEAAAADREMVERIRDGRVDAIAFASPSAFHSLLEGVGMEALQAALPRVALIAIGPVTAAAIRDAGFVVAREAAESSSTGLAEAIAQYFSEKSVTGARMP